ncbi:riboflavin kinase/FMN adenylyltransferase [Balneicella halophila]|uniref:Riboflavin biosynthesis protein n=1 Tax=Balneicella halophila TaxID=1537566 RepID=A0A7L4URQ3_BALHA|nr:bifunctional riboflavin kinase/FAD synthetase [Balneicella halophila]PVX52433.1 riboflavin kinase/FMN adenylyltransferase [Balneicella halophila]
MEVHFDNFKFQVFRPVVTIGTFDGVHVGHRSVIKNLLKEASRVEGESVVITFDPHPRHIVATKESKTLLLNTLTEKIYRFSELGVDHLLIISFTEEFSNLPYEKFFKDILIDKLNIHTLLVGYDHKFGKNRGGNFEMLSRLCGKNNVNIAQTPQLQIDDKNVSSSAIRQLISNGEVEIASKMLSYNYSLKGKVIDGDKIGRTIGFPTANLDQNNPYKLLPKTGVYAVHVYHKSKKFYGMLNIGTRPSVSRRNERKVEVHIFNFSKNIYGDELRVSFIRRIRDEVKFESLEALKEQLKKDKKFIENFFKIN